MEDVLKCDFMVKRAQMKARLLKADNYKGRWFKLTKRWLYYCDGKLEVTCQHVVVRLLPWKQVIIASDTHLYVVQKGKFWWKIKGTTRT